MLLDSTRFKPGDKEVWENLSKIDKQISMTKKHKLKVEASELRIAQFTKERSNGWIATSWGKDSTCIADMSINLCDWPLVWIRAEPLTNPDSLSVRDAFIKKYPNSFYEEIIVHLEPDEDGNMDPDSDVDDRFDIARERYGRSCIVGYRGMENRRRKRILAARKFISSNRCYPILDWSDDDVFAYLSSNELPVHPAYAMSMGGVIPRGRLRVAMLGGTKGSGMGRTEWENAYYPEFAALQVARQAQRD